MRSRWSLGVGMMALAIGLGAVAPCVAAPAGAAGATATEKVDLNRATQQDLETLPGIGPSLAQRILSARQEHGPFQRIEDLMNVQGIGEKNFLRIREHVTVGERKPDKN